MPHPSFNAAFLNALVNHEPNPDAIRAIYDHAAPLYFISHSDDETARQLQEFKTGDDFSAFKSQYELLIKKINQWCVDNRAQQRFRKTLDSADVIPAFLFLYERLFGEADFFSTRAVILFTEGKQSLEQLLLLLGDQSIGLDSKKTVLLELQKSMIVCADGALTNIVNAKMDLLASTRIEHVLEHTKRTLIQQQAVSYIRATHGQTGGNELHFVNGYFNYVANAYGLSSMIDNFVDARRIPLINLNQFLIQLRQRLTPKVVVEYLISKIESDVINLREDIRASFFNQVTSIRLDDPRMVKLTTEVDLKITTLNDRYAPLTTFDMHTIIETIEQADATKPDEYRLAPDHPALIKAMLAPRFNSKYLVPGRDKCQFKIEGASDSWLIYDDGIYWIEQKGTPDVCTPEIFTKLNPLAYNFLENRIYYYLLADLFYLFPEQQEALLSTLISANYITPERLSVIDQTTDHAGKNALWFLSDKDLVLFERLLKHKLITSEQLAASLQTGRCAGINILWLLANQENIGLLEKLLNDRLITSEQLAAVPQTGIDKGRNSLWLLALNNHWQLLEKFCNDKLITPDHLAACPQTGEGEGKNSLWLLALHKQWPLLERLLNDKLITPEHLAACSQTGTDEGRNSLWLLAYNKQWPLLERLLDDKLITPEHVAGCPQADDDKGKNSLWLLANYNHWQLIERLLNDKLITPDQLAATAQTGDDKGTNSLWILARNNHWQLIERLLNDKLITPDHLAACPQTGDDQGINSLWLLTFCKHWQLLEKFCNNKLITSAQLAATPQTGIHAGINVIFQLILNDQTGLLEKLYDDKLITSAHLATVAQTGPNKGFNSIGLLAYKKHIGLIEKLLKDKLITSAHLTATLQTGPNAGINLMWMLAYNKYFGLLEKLIDDKCISIEQLAATPQTGLNAGINTLWFLAANKQIKLLELLLKEKLITSALLAASPETGVLAGKSTLCLLTTYKPFGLLKQLFENKLITDMPLGLPGKKPSRTLTQKRPLPPLEDAHDGEEETPKALKSKRKKSTEVEDKRTGATKKRRAPPREKARGYDPTLFTQSAPDKTRKHKEAPGVAAADNDQAKKIRRNAE